MEEGKSRTKGEDKTNLYYTANQAMEKAASVGVTVTLSTLLSWVDRNRLGFQPGGNGARWLIYRSKFDNFIEGRVEKTNGKNS